jgi:hypothetical protein
VKSPDIKLSELFTPHTSVPSNNNGGTMGFEHHCSSTTYWSPSPQALSSAQARKHTWLSSLDVEIIIVKICSMGGRPLPYLILLQDLNVCPRWGPKAISVIFGQLNCLPVMLASSQRSKGQIWTSSHQGVLFVTNPTFKKLKWVGSAKAATRVSKVRPQRVKANNSMGYFVFPA